MVQRIPDRAEYCTKPAAARRRCLRFAGGWGESRVSLEKDGMVPGPGLNAVEHPVFDVWLTDCSGGAQPAQAVGAGGLQAEPGQEVDFSILRDGKEITIDVVVGERPESTR